MHHTALHRRRSLRLGALLALGTLALPAMPASPAGAATRDAGSSSSTVLSSAPDQITGGDALVQVEVPRQVPARPGDGARRWAVVT